MNTLKKNPHVTYPFEFGNMPPLAQWYPYPEPEKQEPLTWCFSTESVKKMADMCSQGVYELELQKIPLLGSSL